MDNRYRLVNLTSHLVTLESQGRSLVLPVSEHPPARVNSDMKMVERAIVAAGFVIPILEVHEQDVVGLPPESDGVLYVVSGIVAAAANRKDVVTLGRLERESRTGRTKAARALVRIKK